MSGNTKRKARESAENVIPLGMPDRELIISWFVKGYMTGHAAHTRWANKHCVRKPPFTINSAVGKSE